MAGKTNRTILDDIPLKLIYDFIRVGIGHVLPEWP